MSTTAKSWTGTLGPRQKKAVDKALRDVLWEAKTYVELTGVVGGKEHRFTLSSPFGKAREDVGPMLENVGDRYEWTLTTDNYKRVVAEFDTIKRRLEESRPVVDNRRTPAEESARIEESNGRAHDQEIEARARAESVRLRVEELRAEYPWAKADDGKTSNQARAAWNIKQELRKAFPGVQFSVRSDSFSMGDSVDVGWTDGPTSREVETITGKYQHGHFDGMIDMYEDDHSADSAAVAVVLGQSKYVQCQRRESPETREAIERLCKEKFADPSDKFWPVFSASNIPPGASIVGLEDTEEHPWHRLAVELPAQPEAAKSEPTGNVAAEVQKHHHTKKGFDFWLVVLTDRVDRDTFEAIRDRCKATGGWYSRQWGKTPGGFAFETEEAASAFAATM